jgi:hypothetical protein
MASTTIAIEKLAAEIGENIYIDVSGWHLYLSDAHLHSVIAEQIFAVVEDRSVDEAAVDKVLNNIQVPLGGKQVFVSLGQLIPLQVKADLVRLLEAYKDNY